MRVFSRVTIVLAIVVVATAAFAESQQRAKEEAVRDTVARFWTALRKADKEAMKRILYSTATVVEVAPLNDAGGQVSVLTPEALDREKIGFPPFALSAIRVQMLNNNAAVATYSLKSEATGEETPLATMLAEDPTTLRWQIISTALPM